MRGEILSYALQQRVFACGHQAVSVASGASAGSVQIDVAGINKASDTVLITFDINSQTDIQYSSPIYIFAVTDGSHFTVDGNGIENIGAGAVTVFINWAVLRGAI